MKEKKLKAKASLQLPIGHLLVVWDVLANKLPDTNYKDKFTQEELRAIWALEDLCETELVERGIGGKPVTDWHQIKDWNRLMEEAKDFVKTIPVQFLD